MPGSVAIVTGSSSGIGRATAVRLSRDFSAVVLAARNAAGLAEVAAQVRANGAEPLVVDLDLMSPAAAESLFSRTMARFGRIDALLNIAGSVPGLDLFQMNDEQWNAGMELKLHGARRLTLHMAAFPLIVFDVNETLLDLKRWSRPSSASLARRARCVSGSQT
jgi:3-oxoacyl-[acyl-carrier protein] reductase